MSALFYIAIIGGICLALPAAMILFYPIYKLFGGEITFGEVVGGV